MLFEARREGFHAFVGAYLVENYAQHFRVFGAAKQLGLQFHTAGKLGEHFIFRRRDQDHFRVQALGQVQVDPCRVAGAAGRHHPFDDQHVFAYGCLLVKGDDLFEQLIELAVAEHALYVSQAQGLRRFQAVGARHQLGRAFRPGIARVWLGNGFEKADFQAGPFQCAHQPKADGGQTHTKIGGRDKKSLHANSLEVHGLGGAPWVSAYRESGAKVIVIRALAHTSRTQRPGLFFQGVARGRAPRRVTARAAGGAGAGCGRKTARPPSAHRRPDENL